jgi:hypothetical protein
MNCNPFPSPTITKFSKPAFLRGVKWALVGRGATPCHWHWHQGPANGGIGRVDGTRVSKLKLRGKATEPAQNPLIQIMIDWCNHAQGGSLFQSGCQGIQAGNVDHVTRALSRSQGTSRHATMLPSRHHIKKIPQRFKKLYILRALGACWGLEVRESVSNGQTSIWARTCRWCCGRKAELLDLASSPSDARYAMKVTLGHVYILAD